MKGLRRRAASTAIRPLPALMPPGNIGGSPADGLKLWPGTGGQRPALCLVPRFGEGPDTTGSADLDVTAVTGVHDDPLDAAFGHNGGAA
jgi:hypothetical protein